jgi:mannan endo-1,4-beta-mannosidase
MHSTDCMAYLKQIVGHRLLTGQHLVSNWQDPRTSYEELVEELPVVPAMLGTTILTGAEDSESYNSAGAEVMARHTRAGGILVLDIHPPSPWSADQSISSAWVPGDNQESSKQELTALLYGSRKPARRWAEIRTRIDKYLGALPVDGVVIFRPLHEAGGRHFWWGQDAKNPKRSETGVRALYDNLRNYLAPRHRNVLWGWSAGMSWYAPLTYGLPSRFDIIGATLYADDLTFPDKFGSDYRALRGTGKPVMLFETGAARQPSEPTFDARRYVAGVHRRYPAVIGVQVWQDGWAWVNSAHYREALADPIAINLPEYRKADTPT